MICRPVPKEGRFAIVTNAGRDAVDASGATDESAELRTVKSCGPGAPMLALSFAEMICEVTVAKEPGHRGRRECRVPAAPAAARANAHRKTHTSIQGQRRQSGLPCAVVYGLLRALVSRGAKVSPNLGRMAPRVRGRMAPVRCS
jgi:hypothetical protein